MTELTSARIIFSGAFSIVTVAAIEYSTSIFVLLRHFTAVKLQTSSHLQRLSDEYVQLSMLYVLVVDSLEPLRRKLCHVYKIQKSIRARQASRGMIPLSLRAQLAAADERCEVLERESLVQLQVLRQIAKKMSDVGRF